MFKKFFIKTFGCQMNFYDSEKISNLLKINNYLKVNLLEDSNLIIINMCSVREKSVGKIINYLDKIFFFNNNYLIIIAGCVSILFANYLFKKKYANIVVGSQNIYFLPYLIKMYYFNNCNQVSVNFFKTSFYNRIYKNNIINSNNYLTIIEGCNKYCSYCIIPYMRGGEISKFLNIILFEIININYNLKYIFLLGQNVNSYNGKISFNSNKFISFYILLNYISQFLNIKIINFISSYVKNFNLKLINLYKNNFKLINYLHLPIQSCSNKILFKMNRGYSLLDYKFVIDHLRFVRKNFSISTDIIICFLEETNLDFNKTLIFIEKFLFDKSFIFIYNPRPYTKVFKFVYFFSNYIKKKRFLVIQKKIRNNIYYINKSMLGKTEEIFVKGICLNKNDMFFGFTKNNRLVEFFKPIRLNYLNLLNNFIKVKILFKINKNFFSEIIF